MESFEIEFDWMRYGDGKFRHLWHYNQKISLLRSYCHSIFRIGNFQDLLLADGSDEPKCQRCLKAINRKVHVDD